MDLNELYKIRVYPPDSALCVCRVLYVGGRPWRCASLHVIASEEKELCNRHMSLIRFFRDRGLLHTRVLTGEMKEDLYSDKLSIVVVCCKPELVPFEELPLYLYMYDTPAFRRLLTGSVKPVKQGASA